MLSARLPAAARETSPRFFPKRAAAGNRSSERKTGKLSTVPLCWLSRSPSQTTDQRPKVLQDKTKIGVPPEFELRHENGLQNIPFYSIHSMQLMRRVQFSLHLWDGIRDWTEKLKLKMDANQGCRYLIIIAEFHEMICLILDRVVIHPWQDPVLDLALKRRK